MTIERDPDGRTFTIITSLDEIPSFASEKEEAIWWDTHDFSEDLWGRLRAEPPPAWLPPVRRPRKGPPVESAQGMPSE